MNSIVCPISTEKVNKNVVRINGFIVAATVLIFALTGSVYIIAALMLDFLIRAFTTLKYSPTSRLAYQLSKTFNLKPIPIDKAPKLFASRVGFLFTLSATLVYFISPVSSLVIALILMSFALLESLFDFCVGCVVYTYIVLPLNKTIK